MDFFECEGCGIPLTSDMLVEPEGLHEMAEEDMGNMPWACPECGEQQWDQ